MDTTRDLLFTTGQPNFEGFIFDFDGTIADSMEVWYWVDQEFLERRHLDPPPDYGRILSSLGYLESARYVIDHFNLDERPEAIMAEWDELALRFYTSNVALKPHVREFIGKVRALGAKTSIATTLTPLLLNAALDANSARPLFDVLVTSNEVAHDKNKPDIYLLAAQRMDVPPMRCVVFEDIVPGVRSAKAAGMCAVGVRDNSGHQEMKKLRDTADGFIDGFQELL